MYSAHYGHDFAFYEHISMVGCDRSMWHVKMPNKMCCIQYGHHLHHFLSTFQWCGVWQECGITWPDDIDFVFHVLFCIFQWIYIRVLHKAKLVTSCILHNMDIVFYKFFGGFYATHHSEIVCCKFATTLHLALVGLVVFALINWHDVLSIFVNNVCIRNDQMKDDRDFNYMF